MSGWIKCSEREPSREGRYAIIYRQGERAHARAFIGDYLPEYGWGSIINGAVVTHWMELPEIPKDSAPAAEGDGR